MTDLIKKLNNNDLADNSYCEDPTYIQKCKINNETIKLYIHTGFHRNQKQNGLERGIFRVTYN